MLLFCTRNYTEIGMGWGGGERMKRLPTAMNSLHVRKLVSSECLCSYILCVQQFGLFRWFVELHLFTVCSLLRTHTHTHTSHRISECSLSVDSITLPKNLTNSGPVWCRISSAVCAVVVLFILDCISLAPICSVCLQMPRNDDRRFLRLWILEVWNACVQPAAAAQKHSHLLFYGPFCACHSLFSVHSSLEFF